MGGVRKLTNVQVLTAKRDKYVKIIKNFIDISKNVGLFML